jgi:uncharacterized DUF497 family protein
MIYDWDDEKNNFLREERKISFEEIVLYISEGNIVDILKHPNKSKYPNQKIYLVKRENYIYAVPFVKDEENGVIFLKTIFASRKYTRQYLREKEQNNETD